MYHCLSLAEPQQIETSLGRPFERRPTMSHEICWDRDGVVRRFWGHVPFAEVLQSVCEVEVDSRFEKARYLIDDCSGVFDGCLVHDSPLARLDLFQRLS